MKKQNLLFPIVLLLILNLCSCRSGSLGNSTQKAKKINEQNPFFAMTYGFNQMTISEQIHFLTETGYNGIGAWVNNTKKLEDFKTMLASPEVIAGEFNIYGVYMPLNHDNAKHRQLITEVLQVGQAYHIPIWLTLADRNKTATQKIVVEYIQNVCDEAAKLGTEVILYPHDRHFAASVEHTLDIIEDAQRKNLFTTLHLNHELRFGNAERLEEVVRKAAPYARLATISGANAPGKYNRGSRDWSDTVQALSKSAFDVQSYYRLLKKYGYDGPIGYNNFKIPGDERVHHRETLTIYQSWATE